MNWTYLYIIYVCGGGEGRTQMEISKTWLDDLLENRNKMHNNSWITKKNKMQKTGQTTEVVTTRVWQWLRETREFKYWGRTD